MDYKKITRVLTTSISIGLCFILSSCATVSQSAQYYRQAYQQAKRKNYDTAFLKLRALLLNDPRSPYAPRAKFSTGEYYYDKEDYADAILTFYEYINEYPEDSGRVFAELIIYKISTEIKTNKYLQFKERDLIEKIEKKIFSKPMFFLFFDKEKSYTFRSAFGNVYTALEYVDKVEVRRNGDYFLEISP